MPYYCHACHTTATHATQTAARRLLGDDAAEPRLAPYDPRLAPYEPHACIALSSDEGGLGDAALFAAYAQLANEIVGVRLCVCVCAGGPAR